jgi:hypothetical protein
MAALACAQDSPSLEKAAEVAQAGGTTVRVVDNAVEIGQNNGQVARPRVTVGTGVCVENGRVVTPAFAGSDSQIELTLPGGQPSSAQ